ncbi:hypothetical protein RRF57_003741 [Xylaria bambusicola]|uniref:Uncharacterized protein n=1 Tax=Xylaria bambusicola TaxID=326684 RepID=A0AAN7Z3P9_9PEZI
MFKSNPTITAGRDRIGPMTAFSQAVFLSHALGFMMAPRPRIHFPALCFINEYVRLALARGFWLSISARPPEEQGLCDLGPSKGVTSEVPSLPSGLDSAWSAYNDTALVERGVHDLSACMLSTVDADGGRISGGDRRNMVVNIDGPTSSA